MAKILKFDTDAKKKILEGIEALENAVAVTLGPSGKNVIISEYGTIHSTKDGVTVANSITLKDPFAAIGANALKEVASKSNQNCGDGTTTSTILAAEIYRYGLKYIELGTNASKLKDGIKFAAEKLCDFIKSNSYKVEDNNAIKNICTVSANGDKKVGKLIADVLNDIGKDGTIKVENGNTNVMTSSIVKGMVIDQSYASPYFVNSTDSMEVDLDHPYLLICNKKLSNIQELLPALQSTSSTKRPIFIIADDYSEDILATLVMNRLRGLNVCAIKSPSYGDNRKAILEDIAVLCGGRVVSDETGTRLEHAVVESGILGEAKRVLVTKENTVIFDGFGAQDKLQARADSLRKQIEQTTNEFEKSELEERLAKLTSGVGIISVGADTEVERKELRDRVDDAFAAAKSAIKSGYVPGAGVMLLKSKQHLEKECGIAGKDVANDTFHLGCKIFLWALAAPLKKMLSNAGFDIMDAANVINKVVEASDMNYGFNIDTKQFGDLVKDGIIDSTEVVLNEIKNASSIASLLLVTDCIVVEDPDDCKSTQSAPSMM